MTIAIQRCVYNIARSMARKTSEDVEDLTQEGMLGAWLVTVNNFR